MKPRHVLQIIRHIVNAALVPEVVDEQWKEGDGKFFLLLLEIQKMLQKHNINEN